MKGQTTIEYLLLISVVVLVFIGVLVTVNSLRETTQGTVNVSGKEETPTQAIQSQLDQLRNLAGTPPPPPQNQSNQSSGGSGPITIGANLSCGCVQAFPAYINVTLTNGAGQIIDGTVQQLDQDGNQINTGQTSNGFFSFCGFAGTNYIIKADSAGYNTTSKPVTTPACG